MTKEELEQQHPELAAQLRAEGVAAERARYDSFVALGRQSGAIAMALRDFEAGKPLTETMAAHMSYALDQRQIQDRLDDDAVAADATDRHGVRTEDSGDMTALAAAVERISNGDGHHHLVHR